MIKRTEFYLAPENALAFHPLPLHPAHIQWWYHDATFENGYGAQCVFVETAATGMIMQTIWTPEGRAITNLPTVDRSQVIASSETCDVKIGEIGHMQGKYPRYEIHSRAEEVGCDLVYECKIPTFWEPPDGIYLGREQLPATPIFGAYVLRPRCEVSGTLFVGGKQVAVKGRGYADHQWMSENLLDIQHYWCWAKVFFDRYTVICWDGVRPAEMGFQRNKWLWVWRGDQLIEYKANANMYLEIGDFGQDPETLVLYPKRVLWMIDDEIIDGTIEYKGRLLVFKLPAWGAKKKTGEPTQYFRVLADCTAKLNIEGKTVQANYPEVYEIKL